MVEKRDERDYLQIMPVENSGSQDKYDEQDEHLRPMLSENKPPKKRTKADPK